MSTALFSFSLNSPPAGLATTTLDVVRFTGSEAISRLFEFQITLVCSNPSVNSEDVLGKAAKLTLTYKSDTNTTLRSVDYHGIVASWEQVRQYGNSAYFYRAVLRPRLWKLSRCTRSEVYVDPNQDAPTRTVKDIVEQVLQRLGSDLSYTLNLYEENKLRKRGFACQFQEDDIHFVSRITEVEGLYFYFDQHATEKDKLIVTNKRTAHLDAPLAEMTYRVDNTTGLEQDSVSAFVPRGEPLPAKVVLQDYSEFNAGLNDGPASPPEQKGVGTGVRCEANVHSQGYGEVMLYGERILSKADGDELATIRAQELRCRGRNYSGEGSALGLRPGFLTRLKAHYNTSLNNKRFLVTGISHSGEQTLAILTSAGDPTRPTANNYHMNFSAVDHDLQFDNQDVQYRPPLATPKPRFHGTMVAKVDDSSTDGYYAQPDAQGRYKVLLPFVNNETNPARRGGKGSAWIRMAAPYFGHTTAPQNGPVAGNNYGSHGMHFPLHKDAEVLLTFLEGDPDRPVIVGALPNSLTQNVVSNANKTQAVIQTGGGSRIEIEDTAGWERITMSVPYNGSYLRLGAPKTKTGTNPSPPYTGEPKDDPGNANNPKGIYSFFLRSTGKGRYEFPQGFDAITGTNEANFAETYWERYYGWEGDNGDMDTVEGVTISANEKLMLSEADKELNINHNITHTFANNIERTLGDNISTTVGRTVEYTLGDSNAQTIGIQREYVSGGAVSYAGITVPDNKAATLLSMAVVNSDATVSTRANKPTTMESKAFRELLEATGQKTTTLPKLDAIVAAMRPSSKPADCEQAVWDLGGFGLTPDERAKKLYKNPFEWNADRITKAAKELNFQDSWSHTLGDSIEVTLGKTRSYTYGETWEYTYAKTNSYVGTSDSPADSYEEVHGNSTSRVHGNSDEHVFGRADSMHLGGTAEFFLGGQVALTVGPGLESTLIGPVTELNAILLKTCIEAALTIEIGFGAKLEIEPTELKQISIAIKGHALTLSTDGLSLGNNGAQIKANGITLVS